LKIPPSGATGTSFTTTNELLSTHALAATRRSPPTAVAIGCPSRSVGTRDSSRIFSSLSSNIYAAFECATAATHGKFNKLHSAGYVAHALLYCAPCETNQEQRK
jgi:hypothetical protein